MCIAGFDRTRAHIAGFIVSRVCVHCDLVRYDRSVADINNGRGRSFGCKEGVKIGKDNVTIDALKGIQCNEQIL